MKHSLSYIWNTKWALTLSVGLLLGLSYPPVPLPFLVFPAFVLVFRIIELSDSAREAAYWTYPAFVIWNLITTYWLMMATLAGGIAAILANSAVMTVPVMLQYYFQNRNWRPLLIALLQTASWLSYEYLHHQWDLAWPWLSVGNAWANVPELVQYISVTGYWGISFWVIFSCALGYQVISQKHKVTKIILGIVLFLFPVWSLGISIFEDSESSEIQHQVAVVQPNFDSYERYGGYASPTQATDHLLNLTDSVRTQDTDLVVWPENAIQADISNRTTFSDQSTDTKALLQSKAADWDATILTGATYFQYYNQDNAPALPYKAGNSRYLPFNAALGFVPGKPMEVHRKHNLVPIVERVPFVHFLNAVDILGWVNWNNVQGYGKGERANQFEVKNTKTPTLICYDSVFPSWIRKYVQNGAGYLTIITNDGWWGNTSGHEQHFAYARLRAIEFDRWIVRSANNGISGIISPSGAIKVETPYWISTAFNYNVPVKTSQTLYARFGDWLPQLMLIFLAIGVLRIGWNKIRQPQEEVSIN